MSGLTNHYYVPELGRARVAGRACLGMHSTPQDAYRYGYEICADEERHVPLRVSLIDNHGRVREQMMFSEVDFPVGITDSSLTTKLDTRGYQQVAQEERAPVAGVTAWALQNLPPGFRLKMREVRAIAGTQGMVEHLLLSDGLSMVSVYSAVAQVPRQALHGRPTIGGFNACRRGRAGLGRRGPRALARGRRPGVCAHPAAWGGGRPQRG